MSASNLMPRVPAANLALARRLETADAAVNARFAEQEQDILAVAGGTAVFCGVNSPLTQAIALGMNGPVTPAEVDRMEEFFRRRGSAAAIDLCPLADSSLIEVLSDRGYRITEVTNKLVRPAAPVQPSPGPAVRITNDGTVWSQTLAQGFFERTEVSELELRIFEMIFQASTALISEIDGQPVGGGAFAVQNGTAHFFSDATLPAARGRGVQTALIRARLALAMENESDLAMASTMPGSISQRNYERLGFQIVYTRVMLVKTF
jgi:ribosomal protein S18 acetylase RimI-like enzyme